MLRLLAAAMARDAAVQRQVIVGSPEIWLVGTRANILEYELRNETGVPFEFFCSSTFRFRGGKNPAALAEWNSPEGWTWLSF